MGLRGWLGTQSSGWVPVGVGWGSAGGSLRVRWMPAVWVKPVTVGKLRGLPGAMAGLFKGDLTGIAGEKPELSGRLSG